MVTTYSLYQRAIENALINVKTAKALAIELSGVSEDLQALKQIETFLSEIFKKFL